MAKSKRSSSTKGSSAKAAPKKSSTKASSKSSTKPAASQFPAGGQTATEDKENQLKASAARLKGDQQKAASQPKEAAGGFKPWGGKNMPKNGDTVEFRNTSTSIGVYSEADGLVYVNGVGHTPHEWKKVEREKLSATENAAIANEQKKAQTFEQLGVPRERRGENLHEDNPDLHMSMNQNRVSQVVRSNEELDRKKTLTGLAAEEAQNNG